jgi:predicted nuclease of predicted toxin-antitoxin system
VKIRFQADVNLNENIVTGVLRRVPEIDFQTAHAAGLHGLTDFEVLAIAAREYRVLVTRDQRTLPMHFGEFIQSRHSSGVLIISRKINIKRAIEALILIWTVKESDEFVDLIRYAER